MRLTLRRNQHPSKYYYYYYYIVSSSSSTSFINCLRTNFTSVSRLVVSWTELNWATKHPSLILSWLLGGSASIYFGPRFLKWCARGDYPESETRIRQYYHCHSRPNKSMGCWGRHPNKTQRGGCRPINFIYQISWIDMADVLVLKIQFFIIRLLLLIHQRTFEVVEKVIAEE